MREKLEEKIMEEKKVLKDEKIEEVTGGRHYAKAWPNLDLTSKKAFLESVKKLEPKSGEIPKEFLDTVSGGSVFGGELDDWDTDYLNTCISDYKNNGFSLEETLGYMSFCNLSNEALW